MVDAETFRAKVGYDPKDDDLERANCVLAGSLTHSCCGWCAEHDKPRFLCGCVLFSVSNDMRRSLTVDHHPV